MSNKKFNPLHAKLAALYPPIKATDSRVSRLVTEAKIALGIPREKKQLSDSERQAIYDWHVVKNISQAESVNIISQAKDNQSVEIISQAESVNIISQPNDCQNDNQSVKTISQPESVNIISQAENVNIISQAESVKTISHDDFDNQTVTDSVTVTKITSLDESIRFAFYTTDNGTRKRQVIALETFFVDALLLATGIDKTAVTAWIQTTLDDFAGFSYQTGVTKQVKYLIVRELMQQLAKSRG